MRDTRDVRHVVSRVPNHSDLPAACGNVTERVRDLRASIRSNIDPHAELGHTVETHHRFAVILLWWLMATGLLLLAMVIGPTRDFIQSVDDRWLNVMVDANASGLIRLGEVMGFIGSAEATVPFRLGIAIWLVRRAAWDKLGVWVGAIALSEMSLTVLKAGFGRDRPPTELFLEVINSSSFPSGHVIAATAISMASVYVFAKRGKQARHWFYVAAAYVVVMALSRTYVRVHWLSDVIIAIPVGASAVMASVWVVERFRVRISGALELLFGWARKKAP